MSGDNNQKQPEKKKAAGLIAGYGILTSLKLMEVMLAKEKPMSELAAPVVFYPQVRNPVPGSIGKGIDFHGR